MKSKDIDFTVLPTATAPSLYDFLRDADLLSYHDKLKNVLKLRHAGDLAFCEEKDLTRVGMSRPEQKRLWHEYGRRFANFANSSSFAHLSTSQPLPSNSASLVVKLRKKVFGGGSGGHRESTPIAATDEVDNFEDAPRSASSTSPLGWSGVEQHVIPAENISLCKELGKGEFGCVYQAAWRYTQGGGGEDGCSGDNVLQVAVKRVLPEKLVSNPVSFLQEAAIMTRMRHPNVIRLYGVVLDTKAVMLVSELAPCGSLLECLQCPAWREPFPVDGLCDFALQIAQGMRYLANQRLIHRDLAARNVLVASPTKVKISDFGLSRSLGVGEDYYRSEFSSSMRLPVAWCAPEAIKFLRFTSASDVWAYGVTLWEMFTYGKVPWANMTGTQMLMAVDAERRVLEWPDACPDEFYALMCDCWAYEADARPTFDAICERLPDHMPQLLMTVADSKHGVDWHYLPYKRGDILVLLRKCPPPKTNEMERSESRASSRASAAAERESLWFGALKRGGGLVGLFPPEETVAYLGAEYPNQNVCFNGPGATTLANSSLTSSVTSLAIQNGKSKNSNSKISANSSASSGIGTNGKKSVLSKIIRHENAEKNRPLGGLGAESDKERRKLLISQPQGDLRHTGHLGPDGQGFGLVNVDKRELTKPLSPTPSRCIDSSATLPSSSLFVNKAIPTSIEPTSPASVLSGNGFSSKDAPFSSGAHAPPSDAVAPPRPPTAAPRRQTAIKNVPISRKPTDDEIKIGSPPILPPKTYKNSEKYFPKNTNVEISDIDATELDEHLMILKVEAERSLPMFSAKGKSAKSSASDASSAFYSPTPKAGSAFVDRDAFARYDNSAPVSDTVNQNQEDGTVAASKLDRILSDLQRDISDFSLTTIIDYSDTRPLIESLSLSANMGKPPRNESKQLNSDSELQNKLSSTVRGMTPEESEKWRQRVSNAHKKATKSLARELDVHAKNSPESRLSAEKFHSELEKLKAASGIFWCGASALERSSDIASNEEELPCATSNGTFTSKFMSSKAPIEEGWSDEAQAAYKLLVQFGDKLKSTNAHQGDVKLNGSENSKLRYTNNDESHTRSVIEYINPNIVGADEDEEVEEKSLNPIQANQIKIKNTNEFYKGNKERDNSEKIADANNILQYSNNTKISSGGKTEDSKLLSYHITDVNNVDMMPQPYINYSSNGANVEYSNSRENKEHDKNSLLMPKATSDYTIHSYGKQKTSEENSTSNTLPYPTTVPRLPPTVPPKPKRSVPNIYDS